MPTLSACGLCSAGGASIPPRLLAGAARPAGMAAAFPECFVCPCKCEGRASWRAAARASTKHTVDSCLSWTARRNPQGAISMLSKALQTTAAPPREQTAKKPTCNSPGPQSSPRDPTAHCPSPARRPSAHGRDAAGGSPCRTAAWQDSVHGAARRLAAGSVQSWYTQPVAGATAAASSTAALRGRRWRPSTESAALMGSGSLRRCPRATSASICW